MTRKLTRNTSTKESREWWDGVLAAGSNAPQVEMTPKPYSKENTESPKGKPAGSGSAGRKRS